MSPASVAALPFVRLANESATTMGNGCAWLANEDLKRTQQESQQAAGRTRTFYIRAASVDA